MRAALALVVIILLMIFGGWLTFRQLGDKTTITVETKEIKEDTKRALEHGEEAIDSAAKDFEATPAEPAPGPSAQPE